MVKSVLVVDDDPIQFELAQAQLMALGAERVVQAFNGTFAQTLLAKDGPFDLVLLDLNMPEADGIEFLAYLREIGFQAPIIITSSTHASIRNGAAQLAVAYELELAGAIEKPVTKVKLAAALAHV